MPRLQRDLTVRGDLTVGRGGSVRRPAPTHSFPFAGELQGALADGFAEGLVGGDGVEPFGLRLALVAQEVNHQAQRFTFRVERVQAGPHAPVILIWLRPIPARNSSLVPVAQNDPKSFDFSHCLASDAMEYVVRSSTFELSGGGRSL